MLGQINVANHFNFNLFFQYSAFNIGFLAMAPKVMCANTIESVFVTLTNMTRPIEMMVQILDGPDDPDAIIWETPIRLIGTPCACLEMRVSACGCIFSAENVCFSLPRS